MEETGRIQNWKTLFTENALSMGEDYWKRGRVADLKEEKDGYSGAVIGDRRYEVRIRKNPDGQVRMHCTCPQANGGGRCRHMAAVCYAIEEMEQKKEKIKKYISKNIKNGYKHKYIYMPIYIV